MKTLVFFATVAIYILSRFRAAKTTEVDFNAFIALIESDVKAYMASMESDAIELARPFDLLYPNRCNEVSLGQCARGNYDERALLYPNQTIPGGRDLNVAQCGDDFSCDCLWDYSISNTRLHKDLVGASGGNPSDPNALPKEIACSTGNNGICSKIVDERGLFLSLTSYNRLLAIGMDRDGNEDFSTWVEPFRFSSLSLGNTVSVPVYNQSLTPIFFLGVISGIDFPMTAVDRLIGVPDGSKESLNQIVRRSSAVCPTIDLALCELESFRRNSSTGDGALCTTNCTPRDYFEIEEQACALIDDSQVAFNAVFCAQTPH